MTVLPRVLHGARQVLDLVAVGIVWLDRRGRPVLMNATAESTLGAVLETDDHGSHFRPSIGIALDGGWRDAETTVGDDDVAVTLTDGRGRAVSGRMRVGTMHDVAGDEELLVITLHEPASPVTIAGATAIGRDDLATLGLSPREVDVVELLLLGHRVGTIASLLYVSQHTVRNRLKSIFPKLGVHSQVELVREVRGRFATR